MALALFLCLAAVACGGGGKQPSDGIDGGIKLQVITTTVLLAGLVRNVGGELVEVRALVPPGADVHSFQTTPRDSIDISNAGFIVSNGLGLDDFLIAVIDSAKGEGVVELVLADGSAPAGPIATENLDDPHLWLNPQFAAAYVERIRDALAQAYPRGAQDFQDNAAAYILKLNDLDLEIAETLNQVPPELRRLVTLHDAFGHFVARYGWESHAFIASDADEVSPGAFAQILQLVSDFSLPAIFLEPQLRSNIVERAAGDAGVAVGTIRSIPAESGADGYIDMMRSNARALVELLK